MWKQQGLLVSASGSSMWRPQVGTCLLESCQTQLAGCLTDIGCVKNLVCLNKCNGLPDESECQVTTGCCRRTWHPHWSSVAAMGGSESSLHEG